MKYITKYYKKVIELPTSLLNLYLFYLATHSTLLDRFYLRPLFSNN